MKYLLFFLLCFGLPHANWIPLKLQLQPEQIPLGILNLIFLAGFLLWALAPRGEGRAANLFPAVTWFLALNVIGVCTALVTGYDPVWQTMTAVKNQLGLLCLYFIPLAAVRNRRDFTIFFLILLLVHFIVDLEVLRSGVLAGSNFNDSKRGSGPFSTGYYGSDVAGAYLAQVVMFFAAFLLSRDVPGRLRWGMAGLSLLLVFGIYATYARGALVAVLAGLLFMLLVLGLRPRYFLAVFLVAALAFGMAPASVSSRIDQTTTSSGSYDDSTRGRFFYWDAALDILKENPLGVGTGQVRGAMERSIGRYVDPHNGFIYTGIEYGLQGLVVFVILLKSLFVASRRIYRSDGVPLVYRVYALGCAGLVGSLVGCNFFYANFYKDLVMGTIMLHFGMLAALTAQLPRQQVEPVLEVQHEAYVSQSG